MMRDTIPWTGQQGLPQQGRPQWSRPHIHWGEGGTVGKSVRPPRKEPRKLVAAPPHLFLHWSTPTPARIHAPCGDGGPRARKPGWIQSFAPTAGVQIRRSECCPFRFESTDPQTPAAHPSHSGGRRVSQQPAGHPVPFGSGETTDSFLVVSPRYCMGHSYTKKYMLFV